MPTGFGWVNPLNTAGGTIPASTTPLAAKSAPSTWGSSLTFSPTSYSNPAATYFNTQQAGSWDSIMGKIPGVSVSAPSYAPAPVAMPQGTVSNWKDFIMGALGTGIQYALQRDAEKRAENLRKQGVDAEVLQHPNGGYFVQERKNFFTTGPGIAVIIGGVGLLVFAFVMSGKRRR